MSKIEGPFPCPYDQQLGLEDNYSGFMASKDIEDF